MKEKKTLTLDFQQEKEKLIALKKKGDLYEIEKGVAEIMLDIQNKIIAQLLVEEPEKGQFLKERLAKKMNKGLPKTRD